MTNNNVEPHFFWKIFIFIIVGIMAFLPLGYSGYIYNNTLSAKKWIPTEAIIQDVNIQSNTSYDSDSGQETVTKEVKLHYQYFFNGNQFTNSEISFGYGQSNLETNIELFELLKKAKKVEAFVNPNNPSESVLIRELNNTFYFLIWFGSFWLFIFLGYIGTYLGIKASPSVVMGIIGLIIVSGIPRFAFKVGYINLAEQIKVIEFL